MSKLLRFVFIIAMFSSPLSAAAQIAICDLHHQNEIELEINNYPKEIYLVELTGSRGSHSLKVIK